MNSLAHRDFSFDLSRIVNPVSDQLPSGESLRYDAIYDQIREARREDDPVQERGVWKITLKKAEWGLVEKLCVDTLEKRSKDLQVAAWLVEAWLRLYGFPGLREGFRVLNSLSGEFWDTIHPLPEDGDIEYRIAPFEWANEKLPVILKLVPITNPPEEAARAFCWADWENACRPKPPRARGEEPDPDEITQEVFQKSVALTSTADLAALLDLIDAAILALSRLTATLDQKCGKHSPGLGQIGSTLSSIRGLLHSSLSERPREQTAVPQAETQHREESPMSDEPTQQVSGESGPIRNRADAYRRLAEAADYLSRTEPHSPTPYLVKRAIHWGSMKLEDLLPELVRNNSELSEIYRLLQIGKFE